MLNFFEPGFKALFSFSGVALFYFLFFMQLRNVAALFSRSIFACGKAGNI